MKILVTGGCGFIGFHVVKRLVNDCHEVMVIDNLSTGKIDNLSSFGDRVGIHIRDIRSIDAEMLKGVDCILHQAALKSVPKSFLNPTDYFKVNVIDTLDMVLKAQQAGVKKIVLASSSSVYGEQTVFPEKEDARLVPASPYAASKLGMEHIAGVYSSDAMPIVCLRYFNVFGENQPADDEYSAVIPKFIRQLKNDLPVTIFGDGSQERDFTYVENVVEANVQALMHGSGGVFNVADGFPKSINDLHAHISRIMGKDIAPCYQDKRIGDIQKTHADITKISKELRWTGKVSFVEGLERTIRWHLEN